MRKLSNLQKISIKFGIICSMIVAGAGAINAVLGTIQKWNETFKESSPMIETEIELPVTSEDSPRQLKNESTPFIPLWSWYVLAGGGLVFVCGLWWMLAKEDREINPKDI
jgi:hypothetical protein